MEKNELGFKMLKMSHTKQIALETELHFPFPPDGNLVDWNEKILKQI